MKDTLLLSSTEDSLFKIVSVCSGFNYNQLRSTIRKQDLVVARSILAMLMLEEDITCKRAGECINKNHATVVHYKKNHKHSMEYYTPYRELYLACKDEYLTSYREARVEHIDLQIKDLQRTIKKLKKNFKKNPITN